MSAQDTLTVRQEPSGLWVVLGRRYDNKAAAERDAEHMRSVWEQVVEFQRRRKAHGEAA